MLTGYCQVLRVVLNPGGVARDAGVDTRVLSAGALVAPRADTNNDVVVDEGTTGVSLALVATTDIQPARAQHVVGDRVSELGVAVPAGGLVHGPDLHVTQLLGGLAKELY